MAAVDSLNSMSTMLTYNGTSAPKGAVFVACCPDDIAANWHTWLCTPPHNRCTELQFSENLIAAECKGSGSTGWEAPERAGLFDALQHRSLIQGGAVG